MKRTRLASVFIFLLLIPGLSAQVSRKNPYKLNIIADPVIYSQMIKSDSLKKLVDISKFVSGIVLDIRYATSNNFTHKKVYTSARAFARLKVALALASVGAELSMQGLGLKIFDAYRPYAATLQFWDLIHDTAYVASPVSGSRHNRGCAIDLTLIDLKTGRELEMPTPFDDFTVKAGASYERITLKAKQNRKLLIDIMLKHGFTVYTSEWWHYDFTGWKDYELMDISFEDLDRINAVH
ncbi:MAG: M15 family metallopeptidase [Bacteroidota bacterium]|jgi:zinc D-Ala-D-Ala dipeptidase